MSIVTGVDFGTLSVRVSIFDSKRGRLGSGVAEYPLLRKQDDPDHATQSHSDHMRALAEAVGRALADAGVDGRAVESIAIDTTGSSVIPVDERLQPLDDYYLWCDHRAWKEAERDYLGGPQPESRSDSLVRRRLFLRMGIRKAAALAPSQPRRSAPRFASAFEHCDMVAATLCGITDPAKAPRSVCAMGHKWMWSAALGGLPPEEFLAESTRSSPASAQNWRGDTPRRIRLPVTCRLSGPAELGLRAGIPIPVGAFDAHWDAIGAGVRLGDVVNVVGTSTCIIAISETPGLDSWRLRRGAGFRRSDPHWDRGWSIGHRRYF